MKFGITEFTIKQGDITKEAVDAIVTAANCQLSGGGGVDGAVHKAGGPAIMAELRQISAQIKKCPSGEAVITAGGRLKASHVIHAVGPVWHGGKKNEAELLENAYYNSLILAKEYGAKTVALPAISTGAYAYPLSEAAKIALTTAAGFCKEFPHFTELRFMVFSDEALAAYQNAAQELEVIS